MTLLIFIPLTIMAGVAETITPAIKKHRKGPTAYRRYKPHTFS